MNLQIKAKGGGPNNFFGLEGVQKPRLVIHLNTISYINIITNLFDLLIHWALFI